MPEVAAEVPVHVPDVVAPAHHLPDEPLDAVERQRVAGGDAVAVRLLGAGDDLERVEQPEVERRREQRVGQPRGRRPASRPRAGRRRRAGGRGSRRSRCSASARVTGNSRGPSSPTKDTSPSASQPVEVGAHLARRSRPPPATTARARGDPAVGRRGLAGSPASRFHRPPTGSRAVHQDVVPPPGVAVEVLHQQPPPPPAVGPGREVRLGGDEAAGGEHLHARRRPQHEVAAAPGRRRAHRQRLPDAGRAPRRRCRPGGTRPARPARRPGAAAPRGPGAPSGGGTAAARSTARGLDQQHRLVGRVEEVRAQLVGEAPAPGARGPRREVGRARGPGRRRHVPPPRSHAATGLTSRRTSWADR